MVSKNDIMKLISIEAFLFYPECEKFALFAKKVRKNEQTRKN